MIMTLTTYNGKYWRVPKDDQGNYVTRISRTDHVTPLIQLIGFTGRKRPMFWADRRKIGVIATYTPTTTWDGLRYALFRDRLYRVLDTDTVPDMALLQYFDGTLMFWVELNMVTMQSDIMPEQYTLRGMLRTKYDDAHVEAFAKIPDIFPPAPMGMIYATTYDGHRWCVVTRDDRKPVTVKRNGYTYILLQNVERTKPTFWANVTKIGAIEPQTRPLTAQPDPPIYTTCAGILYRVLLREADTVVVQKMDGTYAFRISANAITTMSSRYDLSHFNQRTGHVLAKYMMQDNIKPQEAPHGSAP